MASEYHADAMARGRPEVPEEQRLSEQYGINFTKADAELLERFASEDGVKAVALARELVVRALRRRASREK